MDFAGMMLKPDGWDTSGGLTVEDQWDKADYRVATNSFGPVESLAVNVEPTGKVREVPGYGGALGQRCKVTFVGDGQPDETVRGWLIR